MTRTALGSAMFLFAAAAALAQPCSPSATNLCLSASRFEVAVTWKDFQGNTGSGQAVSLTPDTGYFWFFSASNVELIVKVLDARAINGKFWVFFGALSNVQYDITVRDSANGATKTYHNPSGQFASVGDTSAFDGGAGATVAAHETVVASGSGSSPSSIQDIQKFIDRSNPAPATFTPCPGPSNRLYLSNCRFAVDVGWTDPQSNVGSGQAVQLTADTGYFWFFQDTNVELMIKVLDARVVNGQFWVFFGALSNVQYSVHVVDTISGAEQLYFNPQATFASVGDTGAFRGGYAITVQTNNALSASGTITAAGGGSLSATAADGTVFTLSVPANAIASDQDISMTPVSGVSGFPFPGGLAAGVDLQPDGLVLLPGATLTIHTPSPIPATEETPVAWNGSGEDFFLFPPTPAAGDLQLFISHFGGYGVARGTDTERAAQLPREPLADGDLLNHQLSPLLRAGRVAALPAAKVARPQQTLDWKSDYKTQMDLRYTLFLKQDMTNFSGDPDVCVRLIPEVIYWEDQVNYYLGPIDQQFPGRDEEIQTFFTSMLKKALETTHSRCQNDVNEIKHISPLLWLAQRRGIQVQLEANDAIRCLSFRLDFTSSVTVSQPTPQGAIQTTEVVKGNVILTTPTLQSFTQGTGNIVGFQGTVQSATGGCTYPYTSATADFSAMIEWENLFSGGTGVNLKALHYNVSDLASFFTTNCPGNTVHPQVPSQWYDLYVIAHLSPRPEFGYLFKRDGWRLTGSKSPWATAQQQAPAGLGITEVTNFTLTHTPQ